MDALLANYPVCSDSDSESDSVPAAPVVALNLGYVREAGEEEDLSSDVSCSPSEATESHESESDNESQSESAKDESESENVSQPASAEEGHCHSHSDSESQPESKEEGHSHSHSDNDSDKESDSQPGSKRARITSSPESPVGAASWRCESRPLEATIDSSSNRPRRGYAIREESLPSAMRTFMKSLKWFWTREHNLERRGPPVCQATYEKTRERILCKYFPLSFSSLSLCLSVCLRCCYSICVCLCLLRGACISVI